MEPVFSHHRILEKIGEGGMGVVYRAEDTRLGRQVALKVLPAKSSGREDMRVRLLREARMAASLNHPNICTIHEVGESEGDATPFIVMELLRGETLHAVLARTGALPFKDLLEIAVQVAEGLAEAHVHQVVHRDLKPQNVMVGEGGRVKILDFGLAKPLRDVEPSDDVMTRAATYSSEVSKHGHIVGTAAYMSPEQALGETLDSRSDVFAFGTMLYEMATGRRPFHGQTLTSTIAKILESEPTVLSVARPGLPPDLERIVRRCLQKKPADRYNDTRDLVGDLKELRQAMTSGLVPKAVAEPASWFRSRWLAGGVSATLAVAIAIAAFLMRPAKEDRSIAQASFKQITFIGDAVFPTVSHDGQFVAYATGSRIDQRVLVHDLASGRTLEVFQPKAPPGCPKCPLTVSDVQWSRDGANITVVSNGGLHIVPRLGGPSRVLQGGYRATWSPDGSQIAWVFMTPGLRIVDTASGKERSVTLDGPITWMRGVDWSPTGLWILFLTADGGERSTLWIIKPDGSGQRRLFEDDTANISARWGPNGDAIYLMKGEPTRDLWKLPVSADGIAQGEPRLLMTGLGAGPEFAVFRDGRRLAFQRTTGHSNLRLTTLGHAADPQTPVKELTTGTLWHSSPRFSADGSRFAFARGDGSTSNIFVQSTDSGAPQQLTFLQSQNRNPVWSPDGNLIAFGSNEGGSPRVWQVPASGGQPRQLSNTTLSANTFSLAWAPGLNLLYHRPGHRNYHIVDARTGAESPLFKDESAGWTFSPSYSPDGKQLVVFRNLIRLGQALYVIPIEGGVGREDLARRLTGALTFGTVAQSVDAAPYHGKEVKVAVQARANVTGADNRGQCWLRVDRPNAQRGFFDNMEDRPIRAASWNRYEIAGKVDGDAERIVWGCFLRGVGELWTDEYQLSVKNDANGWTPIAIKNATFEEDDPGQPPTGWSRPLPGYTAVVVEKKPHTGRRSLLISARRLPEGNFTPVAWSADGTQIYALESGRRLMELPILGGEPKLLGSVPLPEGRSLGSMTISPDGRRVVFTVIESRSDIWVIDGFDPDDKPY